MARRGSVNAGFGPEPGNPGDRIQILRVTLPTALESSRSVAARLSFVPSARRSPTNGERVWIRPLESVLSVFPSLSTTTFLFSNPRRREDR